MASSIMISISNTNYSSRNNRFIATNKLKKYTCLIANCVFYIVSHLAVKLAPTHKTAQDPPIHAPPTNLLDVSKQLSSASTNKTGKNFFDNSCAPKSNEINYYPSKSYVHPLFFSVLMSFYLRL